MENNEVLFEGYISSIATNDESGKTDINIYVGDDFNYSILKDAFAKSNKKYIPKWYTEKNGFVSLHSKYKIPVLDATDPNHEIKTNTDIYIANHLIDDPWHYHKALIKVVIKDGAVYPKAIKVFEDLSENDYNPFEGM